MSRCCSWCIAWDRCDRNFSYIIARWVFFTGKHFCSEILLRFGAFLSYSVLPCQGTHRWMLCEQQQTVSVRTNVRQRTRVLLVKTPCSHLRSWRELGPATRVTSTLLSLGSLGQWRPVTWKWTCLWFNFRTVIRDFFFWHFKRCTLCVRWHFVLRTTFCSFL
jgi:hypothetical protein